MNKMPSQCLTVCTFKRFQGRRIVSLFADALSLSPSAPEPYTLTLTHQTAWGLSVRFATQMDTLSTIKRYERTLSGNCQRLKHVHIHTQTLTSTAGRPELGAREKCGNFHNAPRPKTIMQINPLKSWPTLRSAE